MPTDKYLLNVVRLTDRSAIQVSHRIGAVLTLLSNGVIAIVAMRYMDSPVKRAGAILLALLLFQISLSLANIIFTFPISIAVAHNAVASLVLACMGALLSYTKIPDHEVRKYY